VSCTGLPAPDFALDALPAGFGFVTAAEVTRANSSGTVRRALSKSRKFVRIPEALANNGSYAVWSGGGPPSEPAHRARTTDALPNRSSLMRLAGVAAPNMVAGLVTAEALSSIES